MKEKTKFRVNIKTGEIELEGNQKFVEEQIKILPGIIKSILSGDHKAEKKVKKAKKVKPELKKSIIREIKTRKASVEKLPVKKEPEKPESVQKKTSKKAAPKKAIKKRLSVAKDKVKKSDQEFIEWTKNYKPNLKQVDYVLLCGYYTQTRASAQSFRTSDVSKLLKEINVKVSNITSTLYLLNRNKKVDITDKKGRSSYFKVTNEGEKYLVTLLK